MRVCHLCDTPYFTTTIRRIKFASHSCRLLDITYKRFLSLFVTNGTLQNAVLDNQANVTVNGAIVLKDLPVGSHSVTVYAEDSAGNMGASETLFFTIEEPFPILLVASASVVIIVVFAVFLLYMRKHTH